MIIISIGILLCLTILYQRKFAAEEKAVFYSYTAIKYLCAILVGLLYQNYYKIPGDTFNVFYQAKAWCEALLSGDISWLQWMGLEPVHAEDLFQLLPSEPRTRFFAHLVSYFMLISFKNYYVVAMWLTFFQIISVWMLVRNLIQKQFLSRGVVFMGLLFVPSITFWSAGLLKETLMLSFMAVIMLVYLELKDRPHRPKWLLLVVAIASFFLFQLKYYVIIVLLPLGLVTHLFSESVIFQNKPMRAKVFLYGCILVIGVFVIAMIHPVFYSGLFFELIQISHDQIALHSTGALIYFTPDVDAFLFTIKNLPLALISAFFRPFIWETANVFMLGLAIENSIFTLLFGYSIYAFFKMRLTEKQYWWLLAALLYVLAMGLIITLSTPNYGTLARYRVAYMPICWLSCLWLVNKYFRLSKL